MSTQNEKQDDNLLVKLVKKSVGLPIGESSCCGSSAPIENHEQPSAPTVTSSCGCGQQEAQAKDKKESNEQPSTPTVTSSCGCG